MTEFRIADTFTDSLTRLTGEEQKAVKTAAFDLQLNPASPGLSFHRLDKAKDKNFWSVRVAATFALSSIKRPLVFCFATSIITTRPMHGPSGGSWRRIPRPALPSWWRYESGSRKSPSQSMLRRRGLSHYSPHSFRI